jgi:hypothetical protein
VLWVVANIGADALDHANEEPRVKLILLVCSVFCFVFFLLRDEACFRE